MIIYFKTSSCLVYFKFVLRKRRQQPLSCSFSLGSSCIYSMEEFVMTVVPNQRFVELILLET